MISNPRPLSRSQTLIVADGISDRRAHTEDVVGAKHIGVVLNMVVVNFGANKEMVPDVIAETGAKILHEVIAGGVVDATRKVAAGSGIRHIETGAGNADAAKKIEADFFAELGLEERIKVGQDGAVGFVAEITRLTRSPGCLHVEAEASLEANNVSANAEIRATLFRDVSGSQLVRAGRGRQKSTAEKHDVALLGCSHVAGEQQSKDRCEKS